jgi:hypothetical protein
MLPSFNNKKAKTKSSKDILLRLVEDEYQDCNKIDNTKINSTTSKQAHKKYKNDIYYEMKEKKLFTDEEYISFSSHKKRHKLSDKIAKMKNPYKVGNNGADLQRLNKRNNISDRKVAFFRRNTLSKIEIPEGLLSQASSPQEPLGIEEVVEYINIDSGFIYNIKTLQRTEKGFTYLNKLVDRLKHRKNEEEHSFNELKKILCLKENIDEEVMEEGILSNRSRRSCNFFINF